MNFRKRNDNTSKIVLNSTLINSNYTDIESINLNIINT